MIPIEAQATLRRSSRVYKASCPWRAQEMGRATDLYRSGAETQAALHLHTTSTFEEEKYKLCASLYSGSGGPCHF